jgi:hypothetical protein
MIIRAHQCVNNGVDYRFHHQLATIFSASNYIGRICNQSGVLIITETGEKKEQIFPCYIIFKEEWFAFMIIVYQEELSRSVFQITLM